MGYVNVNCIVLFSKVLYDLLKMFFSYTFIMGMKTFIALFVVSLKKMNFSIFVINIRFYVQLLSF